MRIVRWFSSLMVAGLLGTAPALAAPAAPDNAGPVKVVSASWLGGDMNDELVGAAILPDGSILVAGNSVRLDWAGKTTVLGTENAPQDAAPPADAKKAKDWKHPDTFGFIAKLSADGTQPMRLLRFGRGVATIRKMETGGDGKVYVLGESGPAANLSIAGNAVTGTFVAAVSPDAAGLASVVAHDKAMDFGVDSDGDVVFLTKARLTRYSARGEKKWEATWKTHGDNRPGGMALSPTTGVVAVTGYGMTHTGKEPYKVPYGFGFDRQGKPLWSLWNPDPKKQVSSKFGGNGLMADTTGHAAGVGPDGHLLLMLYADGGNSICTRNPANPDAPIDGTVFKEVFQGGPGHGFKGASQTSVVFRVEPDSGRLEKGTWMCAWLSPARANGLRIEEASGEGALVAVIGASASNCPTKQPWYVAPAGGYQGGGFLAVFDPQFKMKQCGYFPGSTFKAVAVRKGTVVAVGHAPRENKAKDASGTETPYPVPTHKGVQPAFGGGERDGYIVVLKG